MPAWVPLAIMAASAALNYQNNRAAQKRQESLRRAMETYQRQKAREQEGAVEKLIERQTPQAREEELASLTADHRRSMQDTVEAATPVQNVIAGNLSPEYGRSQERAASVNAEKLKRAIEQLSTMGAPGAQRHQHGIRFGRAAGDVDAARLASGRVGEAYMTDINNVRPDPFKAMLSQIGMGVGMGMMGMPAGGAEAAAAGGSTGITTNAAGASGLRIGAGAPGLNAPGFPSGGLGLRPRLDHAFSLWGGV
jgi:hypothetical protein